MRVFYHPDFPEDIRRYEKQYRVISENLAQRFRNEVASSVSMIREAPLRAGHLVRQRSVEGLEFRRRNLRSFPFFLLYLVRLDSVIFGSITPGRSDPLKWLERFDSDEPR